MAAAYETFSVDQAGLEDAENFWSANHANGVDYKFAVTTDNQLIAISPESELYTSAKAYRTPREAEQATIGKQPTRTIKGAFAGSVLAPKSQYIAVNPSAKDAAGNTYPQGRAGDPVRAEQTNKLADIVQDFVGNAAHYGPNAAMSVSQSLRKLPIRQLAPAATGVSVLGDLINTAVNAQRGDALYSSTPENIALTGGAAGLGIALQKHFSKPEQVKRELDAIIRRKMGLGSKGKVNPDVRSKIMERGEAGLPMYTFKEWAQQPLTDFDAKYDGQKLPMEYVRQPLVMERPGKPMSRIAPKSAITKEVTVEWLNNAGISPQSVNIDVMQKLLQDTYLDKKSNLGMAMFPQKGNPGMTKEEWTIRKHNAASPEEGMMWDRAVQLVDPRLRAEHELAKAASGERMSKLPVGTKSEENRGKGKKTDTEIVTQGEYEKLGKNGKWVRRGMRTAGFMLPMAAEAFGKTILNRGNDDR